MTRTRNGENSTQGNKVIRKNDFHYFKYHSGGMEVADCESAIKSLKTQYYIVCDLSARYNPYCHEIVYRTHTEYFFVEFDNISVHINAIKNDNLYRYVFTPTKPITKNEKPSLFVNFNIPIPRTKTTYFVLEKTAEKNVLIHLKVRDHMLFSEQPRRK